jgi:hypothetical protein
MRGDAEGGRSEGGGHAENGGADTGTRKSCLGDGVRHFSGAAQEGQGKMSLEEPMIRAPKDGFLEGW